MTINNRLSQYSKKVFQVFQRISNYIYIYIYINIYIYIYIYILYDICEQYPDDMATYSF